MSEIDRIKTEKENKMTEMQRKYESDIEHLKNKLNDLEEKFREGEKKRNGIIFEHEKERVKWNLEKDHLLQERNEL